MKKLSVVICILFLCISSYAQDTIRQKNSICFSHGSIVTKAEQYSPIFDIAYHRTIWNDFKVGIAFQTYLYHHKIHYENPSYKSDCWYIPEIKSNCLFIEIGYSKNLLHSFFIYPYLRFGGNDCNVKYYSKNDTTGYYNQGIIPTFIGGVSARYRLRHISFSLSYDYSMNKKSDELIFKGPFLDCEARPNRNFDFKHSALTVGISYNF